MRIYYGQVSWGWKMYGIGYRTKWFLGFSMQADNCETDVKDVLTADEFAKLSPSERFEFPKVGGYVDNKYSGNVSAP